MYVIEYFNKIFKIQEIFVVFEIVAHMYIKVIFRCDSLL